MGTELELGTTGTAELLLGFELDDGGGGGAAELLLGFELDDGGSGEATELELGTTGATYEELDDWSPW